jgi:hypothetical protein
MAAAWPGLANGSAASGLVVHLQKIGEVMLPWLLVAVMTESGHAGGEGVCGTAARVAPVCGESNLGVAEEVAHQGWSSTVEQSSGEDSTSTKRRGCGGRWG